MGHVAKRPRLYRSDTDFTFTGSNLSRLPLDNNNVAIVKKRKKTKKRKKRKIWGEGCFGERPNPKITTSLFDFLANGSAALLALGQPAARIFTTGPDFYSRISRPEATSVPLSVIVIGQEPPLRLFYVEKQRHTSASGFKKS